MHMSYRIYEVLKSGYQNTEETRRLENHPPKPYDVDKETTPNTAVDSFSYTPGDRGASIDVWYRPCNRRKIGAKIKTKTEIEDASVKTTTHIFYNYVLRTSVELDVRR